MFIVVDLRILMPCTLHNVYYGWITQDNNSKMRLRKNLYFIQDDKTVILLEIVTVDF